MLNQLATKPTQRICCQSQGWQEEMEIWPLPFPLLKKQIKSSVSQPESATADATWDTALQCHTSPLVPCPSGFGEDLCHMHHLLPVGQEGHSHDDYKLWDHGIHTLHCFCPEPLQLHPHMTSPCLTLHITASSCHSYPPPDTFHPSSVKWSPCYLPSTHFMFVFKVQCSWEMHLVHQEGQER